MRTLKRRIADIEAAITGQSGTVVLFGGGQSQEEVDAFLVARGIDPERQELCIFHTIYEDENGDPSLPLRPLVMPHPPLRAA